MLKKRILTAIVTLIVVAAMLFVLPTWVTRLMIAALMLVAAWEWSGLLPGQLQQAQRTVYVGLIVLLVAGVSWLIPEGLSSQRFFALASGWWMIAFVWLLLYPTPIPAAIGWICGGLIIVPAWFSLDWILLRDGMSLLLLLLIVVGADTGAYFSGKAFGRVKLAPQISPGKTWEGVIGGMAVVAALAAVYALQTGGRLSVYLPLCLAVAVISVVGDLTVSVFKRKAGVKDSGRLFPGHGGVLDRIDSIAAATPVFALALATGALA
ncbi:MAG TPA: phosphatidate cytidylyltransferase [Woeseiaceae bacterium]|nr:phosphatidate cytidylyltransferase [Woeseiaceae bacterium]